MSPRPSQGDTFKLKLSVDRALVERFAAFSGDNNPIHVDADAARAYGHARPMAHGAILVAAISKLIGTEIPGAGAVWMDQQIEWLRPVFVGDEVTLEVFVSQLSEGTGVLTLETTAVNQSGLRVMEGRARVKMGKTIGKPERTGSSGERVALVTGGGRGIGAAIAARLAADNFQVVVNYRSDEGAASEVVKRIEKSGGRAAAIAGDVGDPDAAKELVGRAAEMFGTVSLVVHGASPALRSVPALELRASHLDEYMRVFAGGALSLVESAAPLMVKGGWGRLIFLGSNAMNGAPPAGWGAYVAAKYATWGLVRTYAQELGQYGITTNMVSPGMTVTDLTGNIPSRAKEVEARRSPMRRLAEPADTAALIAFLASDAAGYINGVNLPVTGGPL